MIIAATNIEGHARGRKDPRRADLFLSQSALKLLLLKTKVFFFPLINNMHKHNNKFS